MRLTLALALLLLATPAAALPERKLAGTWGTVTIGLRNNNPGNIRPFRANRYKGGFPGAIGISKESYLIFRRPVDGIRAIVINLKIYNRRHGIRSCYDIVKRWTFSEAEPHVVANYARLLAERVGPGIGSGDPLNFSDPCVLKALTRAIVYFENGADPYSAELYGKVFPTCR